MAISKQEYTDRLNRLKGKIGASELDAFLITAQESIYYLTGVTYAPLERPFFIIVYPDQAPVLLVPSLDREHLASAPNVDKVFSYWDYPSPEGSGWSDKLTDLLKGVKILGVEPSLILEIAVSLTSIRTAVYSLVEELRLIKSQDEIKMLRQAAYYADMGMEKIIRSAYSGVSEIEVFSQSRSVQMAIIRNTDFDPLNTGVLTAAWPARLGTQPHGVPHAGERLRKGPHIGLSFLRVNGYAAECERTFFVEPPSPQMKELFEIMRIARKKAFDLIKPGVSCAEIDIAANGYLKEQGLGEYLLHRTGHGFGLGNHEGPWVADGSTDTLRENMLISIQPGIYIPDVGGFRHSDTVLVAKDGYESLTCYPDDLKSLTVLSPKIFSKFTGKLIRKTLKVK